MYLSKSKLTARKILSILIFISSQVLALGSDSSSSSCKNLKQNNYSFSIGNWNDNFLFDKEINNLFNKNIFQTDDDFITTNFWLRISKQEKSSRWFVDSYLNIATNRQLKFRTDFLSLILNYETQLKYGLVRIGSGLISSSNFGGSQIQNFYHKIASIDELSLSYLDESYFGFSVHSTIKPVMYNSRKIQLNGVTSFSFFTDGGPSSIELGLESNYTAIEDQLFFNIHLGCKNYFTFNGNFESFFGKGIVWGILSTVKIVNGIQSTIWVTGNQYGKGSQNHFGISFSFLTQKLIPIIFEDVKYP
ncbi:MAG: hypothetical protein GY936_18185 [Ignavibacteriae bacterium]|nr:hypothetical protein [Ignavibacteriota bacterium]